MAIPDEHYVQAKVCVTLTDTLSRSTSNRC